MGDGQEPPRKLSRQELRRLDREAAKGPPPEPRRPKNPTFEHEAGEFSRAWQGHADRFEDLLADLGDRFHDPEWQSAMIAETRSWGALIDRVPGDAPPSAQGLHDLLLQWSAAATDVGVAIADAVESGGVEATRAASTAPGAMATTAGMAHGAATKAAHRAAAAGAGTSTSRWTRSNYATRDNSSPGRATSSANAIPRPDAAAK